MFHFTRNKTIMSSIIGFLSTLSILLVLMDPCILAMNLQENVIINKCRDFHWDDERHANDSIKVPGLLTAEGNATEFRLSEHEFLMDCSGSRIFSLQRSSIAQPSRDNKSIPRGVKMRGEIYNHFTKDGLLMIDSVYYETNDYCVMNASRSSVVVKVCDNKCSSKELNCINIPKCCGLGQELLYWNFTCQSVKNHTWTPQIYTNLYKKISEAETVNLRYSRPSLKCRDMERWPLSLVQRPKKKVNKPPDLKLIWRILKDGSVVYRHVSRIWIPLPKGDFCVDSFANWGIAGDGHYSGSEKDQVILLCPEEMEASQVNQESWIPYLYAAFLFPSSIFLLLTSIIHFVLIEKLPVHGLTVLSHSMSMFFMYIFLGMAYFTSGKAIDNDDDGVKRGSFLCIAIGILAHFFFIATFVWLTIMNFDLWWTFRIVKPMGQISKRMKKFQIYSSVGWGVPITLISTFVGLDLSYRDIESNVKVPDYGVKSCFVACYARGLYIYYILASLIFVNLIFIISTCITFIRFQRSNQTISSKKTTNSFKLFTKLFFIMGVAWCFELYSWIQVPCNYKVTWESILLDLIMFLQAVCNFVIFCCNERIVSQLEEKFPQYKKALKPIKKLFCIKSSNTTGEGYGMGPQASGSTMRKLSTTISLSAQTDQTQ